MNLPQTDEIDELFNFSTDADESSDSAFNAGELEQIEMLDNLRSNLVEGGSGRAPTV